MTATCDFVSLFSTELNEHVKKKRDVFHLLHKIITYAKHYKAVGYTH